MTDNLNTTTINTASSHFKALHNKTSPLLLTNIWDAASAKLVEASGAKALATSSASLAWSLGYADGYHLPTKELLDAVVRIQRVISIPLNIDIENGYSDDVNEVVALARNLQQLYPSYLKILFQSYHSAFSTRRMGVGMSATFQTHATQ